MRYPEPSYLAGLVEKVDDQRLLAEIQQEYGENITVFSAGRFVGLRQNWSVEHDCPTGIVHGVNGSGETFLLFDGSRHGYEGVMGQGDSADPNDLVRATDFPADVEILLVFQYSMTDSELREELGPLEDLPSPHVQDYFAWIAIYILAEGTLAQYEDFETG